MSYLVGLTGGIGCGKSTIAGRFVALGSGLVDADAVSHALTRPGAAGALAIRSELGAHYFDDEGRLDRALLRRDVFADPAVKARLEAVLHPLIRTETARQVAAVEAPYVLLMVPLLLESGRRYAMCRRVLVVDCLESTQIARVIGRSGLTPDEVRAIIRAQIPRERRLALADDVIDNEVGPERVLGAVSRLDRLYRQLAKD